MVDDNNSPQKNPTASANRQTRSNSPNYGREFIDTELVDAMEDFEKPRSDLTTEAGEPGTQRPVPAATAEARMADCEFRNALLVGDDPVFPQSMRKHLQQNRISTTLADGGDKAMEIYDRVKPDLVILNLAVSDNDLELLRDLRQRGNVPIIVAGHGCDAMDKVVCLEQGADDYLNIPFNMRELSARINAIFRRSGDQLNENQRNTTSGLWLFGGWELRLKTRQLRDPSGALVPLTNGEYALLLAFVEAAKRPLSREHLLQATRIHEDILDRSIDVQILRLRRKLEEDARAPKLIKTERGVGYVFSIAAERT